MNTSFPKFKIFTMRGYILFWNKKNESNEMIKLWKTSRKAVDKFVSNENRTGREECKHTKKTKNKRDGETEERYWLCADVDFGRFGGGVLDDQKGFGDQFDDVARLQDQIALAQVGRRRGAAGRRRRRTAGFRLEQTAGQVLHAVSVHRRSKLQDHVFFR